MLGTVVEASHRLARKFQGPPAPHDAATQAATDPDHIQEMAADSVSVHFSRRSRRRLLHALHVNGLGF